MSDSISYTIREEEKDMDEKENECVAREAYAKTVDQQYKSKVKAYKQSKDLGRALLARLTDEEADLRRAATAWVHNFTRTAEAKHVRAGPLRVKGFMVLAGSQ